MNKQNRMCINIDCPEYFKGTCGKPNSVPEYCKYRVLPEEFHV